MLLSVLPRVECFVEWAAIGSMKDGLKILIDGTIRWTLKGKLHRIGGPAVIWPSGTKYWYFNGDLHRENGPAVEMIVGTKEWYIKGQRHRLDGPAVEYPDGLKFWFYNGMRVNCNSQEEFNKLLKLKAFW